MSLFKRNKIMLFGLSRKDKPKIYITFAATKADLYEYLKKFLILEHFDHYKAWCEIRKLDVNSSDAENEYNKNCIDKSEYADYLISKLTYRDIDIATILRMFGNCIPLNCTFEHPVESDYFISKMEETSIKLEDIENGVE